MQLNAKTCKSCGETKPLDSFQKHRNVCKQCRNAAIKKWCQENRDSRAATHKKYYEDNKERIAERDRQNRDRINERLNARRKDPKVALTHRTRTKFAEALRHGRKRSSIWKLIGMPYEEFVAHIESQFQEGMTWENRDQWHIDHIKPVSSFDDPQDPDCWNYSNLRPLWAKDNRTRRRT